MSRSLLLQASYIFDNSNLIDRIRQTCIDLDDQDEEDIVTFLQDSKTYLDKNLDFDTLNELILTINSCFKHYPDVSMPFLEDFLKNVNKNENYILLTSSVLAYCANSQQELSLPDYHSFISAALNDILQQIQNDQKLIVFDHEIKIGFKNELILNLLLSSNITEKLVIDYFPFIFSTNFAKSNQKFELLLKKLCQSDLNKILLQTGDSNNQLFKFIKTKDFQLLSKMSKESFSMIETAIMFTKSGGNKKIEGLSKDTVLPFVATISVFIQKYQKNSTFTENLSDLIIEAIDHFKNNDSNIIYAFINEILFNNSDLCQSKIISDDCCSRILRILTDAFYNTKKTIILDSIFKLSNQTNSKEIQDFFDEIKINLFNFCVKNMSDLKSSEYQLNLNIFKPPEIVNLIQNSEDIFQTIKFIDNFCHNQPDIEKTKELIDRLFDDSQNKNKDSNDQNIELIDHFLFKNRFYDELKEYRKLHQNNKQYQIMVPSTDSNIDEIISFLLNDENPELKDNDFELLLTKLLENDELLEIYLTFKTYKYADKVFKIDNFLRIYSVEYAKYQDKFINIVNKIFFFNENEKCLLRNPTFSIYSIKIPELGSSIVTQLLNAGSYQSFFCLRNIANEFPLLFYNRYQEVFNHVHHSFEYFSFLFNENFYNEEQLKLAKTAYSSFSFFISTFQLPIMLDKFILWINENVLSFSSTQIAGFMTVINQLCYDKFIKNSIIAWLSKINLIETIGKLLDKDIDNENINFLNYYKYSLFTFLRNIFEQFNKNSINELIQIDELKKVENPFDFFVSRILNSTIWVYLDKNADIKGVSPLLADFIRISDSIRDFWVSYHIARVRERKPTPEQINSFIEKIELNSNKNDQKSFELPQFPSSFSTEMIRYLSLKPAFLYDLFIDNKTIPLVQLYYEMICESNNKLQSFKNEDNKESIEKVDFNPLILNFQQNLLLLSNLIKQINSPYINDEDCFTNFYDIFDFISSAKDELLLILDLLSQNLKETFSKDKLFESPTSFKIIHRTIRILSKISNKDEFKDNFFEKCGNELINILLSPKWRNNLTLLTEALNFIKGLNEDIKIPIRVTQIMSFLIISNNEEAISTASVLYSKFSEKERSNLDDLFLSYFDNETMKDQVSSTLIDVIKNVPIIIKSRGVIMINILEKLINEEKKDERIISSIGEIFNSLAPNRENSSSQSQVIERITTIVPDSIRVTSPFFWDLFEKHSQMIYDIINKNPLYLDKFKFLLSYPELLSFKTRSLYFRKKMKMKINKKNILNLEIDRNDLLGSSFYSLKDKSNEDLLSEFNISFINEKGIDLGGLKRDWFTDLTKELFKQNYGLFNCVGNNKSYRPNNLSFINRNHLDYFKFAGKFIARALIEPICIDAHLANSFCKQILHRVPDFKDLEEIDHQLFQSLESIREIDDAGSLEIVFAFYEDEFGVVKTIELIENGENIPLDNTNKESYINLRFNYAMSGVIKEQLEAFSEGFDSLIPHAEIRFFTAHELDLLICGIPEIDVEDFKKNTVCKFPYNKNTPVVKMFFNVLSSWDNEKRAKLLLFMTGSSRVPSNGFKEFCELTGKPLTICYGGKSEKLPQAHTCYNILNLPQYENEEELSHKLLFAIQNSSSFGLS